MKRSSCSGSFVKNKVEKLKCVQKKKKKRKISIASKVVASESQNHYVTVLARIFVTPLIGPETVSTDKTSRSHQLEGSIDSTIIP